MVRSTCSPQACSPATASRVEESYADQMLSAMRFGFGGHVEMPQ